MSRASKKIIFGTGIAMSIILLSSLVGGGLYMLRHDIVEAFKIPSEAMEPSLIVGDHILVWKWPYRNSAAASEAVKADNSQLPEIERGDIDVYTMPDDPNTKENEEAINIIKRVIALPGEKVQVCGSRVLIDGKLLDEAGTAQWVGDHFKNFPPQKVPPGKVFLLGDSRNKSKDSRFYSDPFVDIARIKGRAFFIYFSTGKRSRFRKIVNPQYSFAEQTVDLSKEAGCESENQAPSDTGN